MTYTVQTIAPIFLFPFFAFVINAFLGRKIPREGDWVSVLGILGSFVFAFLIFKDFIFDKFSTDYYVHKVFNWFDLSFGETVFKVDMGIYIDNMSAIMLLMVTAVATMIHIFSTWYMHDDERYGRFFIYLSLFTSAMLGLVLSDNLLSVFIFWELMGFCSYSLIGFYYEKEKAGYASLKAFMTTRVGDVFFPLGIVALWDVVGSVTFVDIYAAIAKGLIQQQYVLGIPLATFAGFCIFMGTIGKSAQFPLQVWLPDAMMGPTPCSALIHAATMVAAGVYLSLRMYPLMDLGGLSTFIALIGSITAFGAAMIALVQTDLKAVLAFSTISQLGYMVIGVGVGSYNAAFMHLITHAVFKACLFLSAGSIIHNVHEQEMPLLGGLRKKLPFTFVAMMSCTFAIAGIPFFAGYVSKDRILGDALYWGIMSGQGGISALVPILGMAGAFLTAFYMFRMMFLIFYGQPRDKEIYSHCHHEHFSATSNLPLLILTVFTFGFWYCGTLTGQSFGNLFGEKKEWFKILVEAPKVEKFLSYQRQPLQWSDSLGAEVNLEKAHYHHQSGYVGYKSEDDHGIHHAHEFGAIASIVIAFLGVLLAYLMYIAKKVTPLAEKAKPITVLLQNKYYFDYLYIDVILERGLVQFNRFLAWFDMGIYDRFAIDGWESVNKTAFRISKWFDNVVIDSVGVDGQAVAVNLMNLILRIVQSGKIQFYFFVLFIVLFSYVWTLTA